MKQFVKKVIANKLNSISGSKILSAFFFLPEGNIEDPIKAFEIFNNDIHYYLIVYTLFVLIISLVKNRTFVGRWYQVLTLENQNVLYLKIKTIRNIFGLIFFFFSTIFWLALIISIIFTIKFIWINTFRYFILCLAIIRQLITLPFVYLELTLFKNAIFGDYLIESFLRKNDPKILNGFKSLNAEYKYNYLNIRNIQNSTYDQPFFKRIKIIIQSIYFKHQFFLNIKLWNLYDDTFVIVSKNFVKIANLIEKLLILILISNFCSLIFIFLRIYFFNQQFGIL